MKQLLVRFVIAFVMLVAVAFAANEPQPDQNEHGWSQLPDLHFQQYEAMRPFLALEGRNWTAMCRDNDAR